MSKKESKKAASKAPAKRAKRPRAAEPVVTTAAAQREERNGVMRPREGGACAEVWSLLDKLHASGTVPATKDARDLATAKGLNVSNAVCELSRWRKFNGLARTHNMKPKRKQKAQARAARPAMRTDGSVDQYLA